jgi:sugar phosphate isomerase/epimerase
MEIGILTYDCSDNELSKLAEIGYKNIEMGIDGLFHMTNEEIEKRFNQHKLRLVAINAQLNYLDPDLQERKKNLSLLDRAIDITHDFHLEAVSIFAGRDPEKSIEDNLEEFKIVFIPIVEKAEKLGVKLAIEGWPGFCEFPFRGVNIGFRPAAWDMIFATIPSRNLGLNFDPSHLVWMGIDYLDALRRFKDRIFFVHAKDTEILNDKLKAEGIYAMLRSKWPGNEGYWWRYRLPGLGDMNWVKFITSLREIGYEGIVSVEYKEDPLFKERLKGLIYARKFLSMYIF